MLGGVSKFHGPSDRIGGHAMITVNKALSTVAEAHIVHMSVKGACILSSTDRSRHTKKKNTKAVWPCQHGRGQS